MQCTMEQSGAAIDTIHRGTPSGWTERARPDPHAHAGTDREASVTDVLIVGAGFSGLAMALELIARGRDFRIIEKHAEVGGTWALNTYPGAACDVPSHLYQLSRRPHPGWSRSFAPQSEILDYLRDIAAEPAIASRLSVSTPMRRALWDEASSRWRVSLESADGGEEKVAARHLVLASGMLHAPSRPQIEGLEEFAGTLMHSAEWDPCFEPEGRRVAVIGTGASAIQIVPALARAGAKVDLYQRTAPHVVLKKDRPLGGSLPSRHRALAALYRRWLFEFHETRHMVWRGYHRAVKSAEEMSGAALEAGIEDPKLRTSLAPTFQIGCKRILQSSDYYPAIASDAVDLVTDPIERVIPRGPVAGGVERPADAIVLATGFRVAKAAGLDVRGTAGTLQDAWADHALAHAGTHVAGFPNMSVLLGPGTGLGHSSVVLMAEAQAAMSARLMDELDRRGRAWMEVAPGALEGWAREHAAMASRTVWGLGPEERGCRSWYHDAAGRPSAVWPGTVRQFRRRTKRVRLADFILG